MIDDLIDPEGTCTLAASGVEVIEEYIRSGVKFSWPVWAVVSEESLLLYLIHTAAALSPTC
jgi:hypothetical protein